MNPFELDLLDQPRALTALTSFYRGAEGRARLASLAPSADSPAPLLTGMGSSYYAACVAADHLHALGLPAQCYEAADLALYGGSLLSGARPLLYVSQSGASAEIRPILGARPPRAPLIAITNDPASPLAQSATLVLPLCAGTETLVACKTYLNSLALLWLVARTWAGHPLDPDLGALDMLALRVGELLLAPSFDRCFDLSASGLLDHLTFLGYGPHAATARQAAMMLTEWAKLPTLGASAGAFRHGLIEGIRPGSVLVLFAPPGPGLAPAVRLSADLASYGARVVLVSNGTTLCRGELLPSPSGSMLDEFLSPVLDIIPAQTFAESLARARGVPPEFTYIGKVVTQL